MTTWHELVISEVISSEKTSPSILNHTEPWESLWCIFDWYGKGMPSLKLWSWVLFKKKKWRLSKPCEQARKQHSSRLCLSYWLWTPALSYCTDFYEWWANSKGKQTSPGSWFSSCYFVTIETLTKIVFRSIVIVFWMYFSFWNSYFKLKPMASRI